MNRMFNGCASLTTLNINGWDTSKVTDMGGIFYNSAKKVDISGDGWTPVSIKREQFGGFYGWISGQNSLILGRNWFGTNCEDERIAKFLALSNWTDSSVKLSLITNLYDRKANGLPDLTLALHANTKKVLSEDDIAAITAKGYIIA